MSAGDANADEHACASTVTRSLRVDLGLRSAARLVLAGRPGGRIPRGGAQCYESGATGPRCDSDLRRGA
jgi:hypothetical protein